MRRLLAGVLCAALLGLGPAVAPAGAADGTLVVPAASATLPPSWHEAFRVGYGKKRSQLGTSRGGDSGTLRLGPEYGAPAPDGSWWFLDAAKKRLAHYSPAGRYLGQARIPQRLLVGGRYFQWQLPFVMADGTLVASRQDPAGSHLLRLRGTVVDEIAVDGRGFYPAYSDGKRLYGFAGGRLVKVNPATGGSKPVAAMRTPSGSRFNVAVGKRLTVALASGQVSLALRTASGARAHVGLQLRAGTDDTLHLYLLGAGEDDESVQLAGATQVSPDGVVAPVEALPDPFTEADPGSPAQLAMAAGSSTPQLVHVLPDGVHVYQRG